MKVYIGDIVKVRVDVIVDPIDTDFTPGGGAARWIAKFTGNEIFKEAQKNMDQMRMLVMCMLLEPVIWRQSELREFFIFPQ